MLRALTLVLTIVTVFMTREKLVKSVI